MKSLLSYNLKILPLVIFIFVFLNSCSHENSFSETETEYWKYKDKIYEIDKLNKEILNLWAIGRHKENIGGIFLCNKLKILQYHITVKEADLFYDFIVEIDEKYYSDEELFWKKDFSEIKDNKGNSLKDFLTEHKIPYDKFERLKSFLKDHNYYGIWMNDQNTVFSLTPRSGLIHTKDGSSNAPTYGDISSIKKIDENWYYFTDSSFP